MEIQINAGTSPLSWSAVTDLTETQDGENIENNLIIFLWYYSQLSWGLSSPVLSIFSSEEFCYYKIPQAAMAQRAYMCKEHISICFTRILTKFLFTLFLKGLAFGTFS